MSSPSSRGASVSGSRTSHYRPSRTSSLTSGSGVSSNVDPVEKIVADHSKIPKSYVTDAPAVTRERRASAALPRGAELQTVPRIIGLGIPAIYSLTNPSPDSAAYQSAMHRAHALGVSDTELPAIKCIQSDLASASSQVSSRSTTRKKYRPKRNTTPLRCLHPRVQALRRTKTTRQHHRFPISREQFKDMLRDSHRVRSGDPEVNVSPNITGVEIPEVTTLPSGAPVKYGINIAIAGCDVSNTTALTGLLACIFQKMAEQTREGLDSGNGKGKDAAVTKFSFVSQKHFRIPKHLCPMVTWKETYPYLSPEEMIKRGAGISGGGGGSRSSGLNGANAMIRDPEGKEEYWETYYNRNIGIDPRMLQMEHSSTQGRIPLPLLHSDEVEVPRLGVNLDCLGAFDWEGFSQTLNRGMKANDAARSLTGTDAKIRSFEDAMKNNDGRNMMKTCLNYVPTEITEKCLQTIQRWIKSETYKNAKLGFEGRVVVWGVLHDIFVIEGPSLFIYDNTGSSVMMDHCDVKLFLPMSKAHVKEQRTKDWRYPGQPYGSRKVCTTWESEGYFDHIAWPNYRLQYAWLVKNGDIEDPHLEISDLCKQHDICVRPGIDTNMELTIQWVVRTILVKLSEQEDLARQAHVFRGQSQQDTSNYSYATNGRRGGDPGPSMQTGQSNSRQPATTQTPAAPSQRGPPANVSPTGPQRPIAAASPSPASTSRSRSRARSRARMFQAQPSQLSQVQTADSSPLDSSSSSSLSSPPDSSSSSSLSPPPSPLLPPAGFQL